MRKIFSILLLGVFIHPLAAQEASVLRAAMYLSGACSEEEIPADWIERVEAVGSVWINSPRLRAGVLLSQYQVASILDYRSRCGDILSGTELAMLDGFSPEAVQALGPFLSFVSSRSPGAVDTVRLKATALLRGTLGSFGGKARVTGDGWQAGGAWRGKDGSFHAVGGFLSWRFIAGDFHTRWGQGLVAWTGFPMESLSTVSAFSKRATGLSPVWSYSSANVHRGVAVEYGALNFTGAVYAALGRDFGAHGEYLWKSGQVGGSALFSPSSGWAFSLDGRQAFPGLDLALELALRRGSFGGKAALLGKCGSRWNWAAQGRYLPSRFSGKKYGEYALAGGFQYKNHSGSETPGHLLSLTADAAMLPIPGTAPGRFQLRAWGIWQWRFNSCWLLDLRLTERYRNYEAPRTDVRVDVQYGSASGGSSLDGALATGGSSAISWQGTARLETVRCGTFGALAYLEGGVKGGAFSAFLRVTGFLIDGWAARIYCYERDAPGNFNVPAYYGRGFAPSLVGSYKLRLGPVRLKGNLRAACVLRRDRHPSYTLNLQIQADL